MNARQRRAATAAAPVTDEQRRLAYRQLARPGWPPFEHLHLPQHHLRAVCVEGLARNLSRAAWGSRHSPLNTLPQGPAVPPTPLVPPPTARPRRGPSPIDAVTAWTRPRGVDLKRAAANDKDD